MQEMQEMWIWSVCGEDPLEEELDFWVFQHIYNSRITEKILEGERVILSVQRDKRASAGHETNPGEDDPVERFGDLQG